jgi:NAD(P)-dependent dehydrogenase (short-subunit alcohol dehydrogenase family)
MRRRGGHIVNVADAAAAAAWPSYLPYALSKAGLVALTRGLAPALRPHGIAVNCVAPGAVLRPPGFPRARWTRVTRGRAAGIDEVAAAVVYFATCPPRVTGRIVKIDGGRAR